MKNKLVVLTDLGSLKAYKVDHDQLHSTPRLELIDQFNTVAANGKVSDLLTDQAGRFAAGSGSTNGAGAMSSGERHNIQLEQKKRALKQLAQRVNTLVQREDFDTCYFAASKEIHQQLLEELAPHARAKISRNVHADLTRIDKSEILRHFAVG